MRLLRVGGDRRPPALQRAFHTRARLRAAASCGAHGFAVRYGHVPSSRSRSVLTSSASSVRRGPGCRAIGPVLRRFVEICTLSCVAIASPVEAVMAGVLFIVSATTPGIYTYLKLTSKSEDAVILDRRKVDRRRSHQGVTPERRNGE